jgi:DNA-binding NarL/FixJ family response regulator
MIRLVVIEDHPIMREALATTAAKEGDVEVVAAVGSVAEFEEQAVDTDLVLLDLVLPGDVRGVKAVTHLVSRGFRVLVMSAATDRDTVLRAFGAGAVGYVSKEAKAPDLLYALRTAVEGTPYVSPKLAKYMLEDIARKPVLTPREREILTLLAKGYIVKEISIQLQITQQTVATHLDRIRQKTNARRKADLVRLAYDEGLIDHGDC